MRRRAAARRRVALCCAALIASPLAAQKQVPAGAIGPAQPPQAIDPANDPSFDAVLPPLDQVQAPPAAPAVAATASTPADAIAPPPPADPALTAPLPSLAGFDPTPDIGKAAVPSKDEARIRYTVTLEGLKEIGLAADFKASSALDKGQKAANAAQVQARAVEDVGLAEKLMRAQGYYDAQASFTALPVADRASEYAVTITATPGMRYDFTAIAITGAAPEPTRIARDALALKVGDPIVATQVLAAEANVGLVLPQQGYPFAKTGDRDIVLDDAVHGGDYTLPLDAGPRSIFGGLRTEGDDIFRLDHLAVFPRFERGELYDQRGVEDLRQALVATSLFSSVAVQPVDSGAKDAAGNAIVDLMVTQHKGPWRVLSGSAGYGTGEGAKVEAAWTNRNLFPPEGALTVSAIGGTNQQGANVAFVRSNAGQRDRTFTISGGFNRSDYDAYQANTLNLDVVLARQSTPIWQKRWTWSVGVSVIGTNEQGAALTLDGDRPRRNYLIGAIPLQGGYDSSDDLLNPTKGLRANLKISPETSLQSGLHGYARVEANVAKYQPIGKSIVLAARVRVGSILGVSLDDIAPSRRLYSGGGGSVRGYGFQKIGPQDVQDNPIGGRTVTEFGAELRYRFGNFGIVPFLDAGRIGLGSTPGIGGLQYGAGIGGRYYTNFGPLRLDVGTPLNRRAGQSRIGVYLSIGQAF
ncbi:autotransporter assembly complex protein TamA [Sphingomonas sp.]|uniref:autotransporter assembly complex protein TamA n=1 Tax=Sphingomonas sp. TaxID=28214 RepID=UPI003AFFC225